MNEDHSKLHSIYSALDAQNYNRALKHTQNNPNISHWNITRALRVHCLERLGRREECLAELSNLICYLDLGEIKSLRKEKKIVKPKPKGKKGYKRGVVIKETPSSAEENHWIDELFLPINHNPISKYGPLDESRIITDETTLATVAITLRSLRLPRTLVSLYTFPISQSTPSQLQNLFFAHINLPNPPWKLIQSILIKLSHLSGLKLHYSWACHACLLLNDDMFARLAEGLLKKKVLIDNPSGEDWRLYLRALKKQEKYEEALSELEKMECREVVKINDEDDVLNHMGSMITLTIKEKEEFRGEFALLAGKYELAKDIFEQLWKQDKNWKFGKEIVKTAWNVSQEDELEKTRKNMEKDLKEDRGDYLLLLEMSSKCSKETGKNDEKFQKDFIQYGNIFADKASCCFEDLKVYLHLLLECSSSKQIVEILKWCWELRENEQGKDREKLRRFIAGCQIALEIERVVKKKETKVDMEGLLPTVTEMLKKWENSLKIWGGIPEGGQKENHPGDELILLSTSLLIPKSPIQATTLLEYALIKSPYNPSIKITLITLYTSLSCGKRSLELYEQLDIKQIQLDSLSHLILPTLISNGYFAEAIQLCSQILSMHKSAQKEISEGIKQSYENGNQTQAEDMTQFRDLKLRNSLQLLAAKGAILDLASLFGKKWGDMHGITGICNDVEMERTKRLTEESGDWYGSPSLLKIALEGRIEYEDNRDCSMLPEFHYTTPKQQLIRQSYQRGGIHSILIQCSNLVHNTISSPRNRGTAKMPKKVIPKKINLLTSTLHKFSEFSEERICVVVQILAQVLVQICTEEMKDVPTLLQKATATVSSKRFDLFETLHVVAFYQMTKALSKKLKKGQRAEVLKEFLTELREFVIELRKLVQKHVTEMEDVGTLVDKEEFVVKLLDQSMLKKTRERIKSSQKEGKDRILPILNDILEVVLDVSGVDG